MLMQHTIEVGLMLEMKKKAVVASRKE